MAEEIASRTDWIHKLQSCVADSVKDSSADALPPGFVEQYLRHLPDGELTQLEPAHVAALIEAHLALGRVRRPGEAKVQVVVPADDRNNGNMAAMMASLQG